MMRNLEKRISNTYYTPQGGSVGQYLSDISKYKILSDSDTRKLLKKAKNGDSKASDEIVKCNQRFVFSLAKRFSNGDSELLLDLVNEANIGLINSIKRFNPSNENTFLTYSVYWMQRQIFLYLTFINPMVKASNKAKTTKVSEIKNKFMMLNGRNPTSDEILDELQSTFGVDILNETDIYQVTTTSIDSPNVTENYDDLSSFFLDNQNRSDFVAVSHNSYGSDIEDDYSKSLISNSIGVLSKKERRVIELLYGIGDYREYEVQEVAEKMGISKEGVRVINKRALEKLKDEITIKQEVV